jgi:hypothetical protein
MNKKKTSIAVKTLAVILTILMFVGILPVSGLATDSTETTEPSYSSEITNSENQNSTDLDSTINDTDLNDTQSDVTSNDDQALDSQDSSSNEENTNNNDDAVADNTNNNDVVVDNTVPTSSENSSSTSTAFVSLSDVDYQNYLKFDDTGNYYTGINTITLDVIGLSEKDIKVYFGQQNNNGADNPSRRYFNDNTGIVKYDAGNSKIVIDFNKYLESASLSSKNLNRTCDLWVEVNGTVKDENKYTFVIDNNAPSVENLKYSNSDNTVWTKDDVTVTFDVKDEASGVKEVTVDGNVISGENGKYSFDATEHKAYEIVVTDNLNNEGKKVTSKIKIDNTAPVADDISITFEKDNNIQNALFNLLSFGLYSNSNLKVIVNVKSNQSKIDSVKLFDGKDGENEIQADGNPEVTLTDGSAEFILTEKNTPYNLYVQAVDVAGNSSEKISIKEIKLSVADKNAEETIEGKYSDLQEVIVKNSSPIVDEISNQETITESTADEASTITSDKKYVFTDKATEVTCGIKEVKVYFGKSGNTLEDVSQQINCSPTNNDFGKTTELTATYELENAKELETGDYTVRFVFYGNNGNSTSKEKQINIDNSSPTLDGGFSYSNATDGKQSWTNKSVTVGFKVKDDSNIESVTVDNAEVKYDKDKDEYSFVAKENTEYTVVVTDKSNNVAKFTTEEILIDTKQPVFLTDSETNSIFKYSNAPNGKQNWTNDNVKISFSVKDEGNSGIKDVTCSNGNVESSSYTEDNGIRTYEFKVTKYGTYKFEVTDNAGNTKSAETKNIYIDKTAPEISKVEFGLTSNAAAATINSQQYGLYANQILKMTVTVDNIRGDGENGASPLSDESVSVFNKNDDNDDKIKLNKDESDFKNGTFVFYIDTADVVRNLSFIVKDTAGNSSGEIAINSGEFTVSVNDNDIDDIKDSPYEVVTTCCTAGIEDIKVEFDKEKEDVYSGTGTFSTNIEDEISGFKTDKIKVEFGKSGEELNDVTSSVSFENQKYDSNINEKLTSLNLNYETGKLDSGEYTFSVTVVNNSGNKVTETKTVKVDNTAPEITRVDITTDRSKTTTVTPYGLYTSEPVTVTVTANDECVNSNEVPSAGIDSINLYNGDNEINGNDVVKEQTGYSRSFTLENSDSAYLISAEAVDAFENTKGKSSLDKLEVYVNNEIITAKEGFEIVVCNKDDKIINSDYVYEGFSYEGDNKLILSGDGTITTTITDKLSGIKEVSATITKDDKDSTSTEVGFSQEYTSNNDDSKNISTTITFNSKVYAENGIESGKYVITYNVTNNCGISKDFDLTFYIDKEVPEVTSIEFAPASSSDDKIVNILNILSFGLYAKNDINVIVTVKDSAPSSGVKEITLSSSTGKGVSASEITMTSDEDKRISDGAVYTRTFSLSATDTKALEKGSFYNDLVLSVTDNAGNSTGEKSLLSYYNTGTQFNLPKDLKIEDNFDIVATTLAPEISNLAMTEDDNVTRYDRTDGTTWFSGDATLDFDVSDDISKIHSVKVVLNGTDVTQYCKDNDGNSPAEYTTFKNYSDKDNKVETTHITLDTAVIANNMLNYNGKNTLTVTATGNNECSSTKTVEFYVDVTAPDVTGFEFSGVGTVDGNEKPVVTETDYGYYFKDATNVTVTANDDIGVGVKHIYFYTVDINGNTNSYSEATVNSSNQATFTVEANFKGRIYASATDLVNNTSQDFNPDNVVVENQTQHNSASSVKITKVSSASGKDNNNQDLYNADALFKITVSDTYSGIAKIEYTVTSPYDTENNQTYSLDIGSNARGETSIDGWTVEQADQNLATVVSKTIKVSNNSNDIVIWAKVTDRAGFTTEEKLAPFSIDKVNPKIDVKYDINNPNTVSGTDYYKEVRTATITVTERNFNPDDFKCTMTNADGQTPSIVSLSNWTTNYDFAADPDSTTHTATITFSNDGDYTLDCTYTDLAGNKAADYGTDKFTIDRTAPEISVSYDNNAVSNGSYYDANRVATITIKEHNFYASYVDIKVSATDADNSTAVTAPSETSWSSSGDVHTATISFNKDGKYSFTVNFKDMALNDAKQYEENTFYIDTKIDKIEITNVKNETAYDGKISPVVTYFDNNYASADYTLTRVGYDAENNKQTSENVDNITPSIIESETGKTVSYNNFPVEEINDGIYILHATITDLAGNKEEKEVIFSVNRYGSTFMLGNEDTEDLVNNVYTNSAPDVVVKEINVNEVSEQSILLSCDTDSKTLKSGEDYTIKPSGSEKNWHEYSYTILSKNFENEGNYTVTVSSTDHFKNKVSNRTANSDGKIERNCPVSFVVDKTQPLVTVTGIEDGLYTQDVTRNVKVVCEDTNIDVDSLAIYLDGELYNGDYTVDDSVVGSVEVSLTLEADGNGNGKDFSVKISDKASNDGDKEIKDIHLNAPWYLILLHNTIAVIGIGVGLALIVALIVFFIIKKRKKGNNE